MSTFTITRVTRWLDGIPTAALLARFVLAAVFVYRDPSVPGPLLLAASALIALALTSGSPVVSRARAGGFRALYLGGFAHVCGG